MDVSRINKASQVSTAQLGPKPIFISIEKNGKAQQTFRRAYASLGSAIDMPLLPPKMNQFSQGPTNIA